MATLETEHVFKGDLAKVFQGIGKYEEYPDYIPGVMKTEILPAKKKNSTCQVRYELNIIKTFYYVLNMYQEEPNRIWWDLEDSNIMKKNDGSWELEEQESGVHATYKLDVNFKGLVPGKITDKIAKANIPGMMDGFQNLIDAFD